MPSISSSVISEYIAIESGELAYSNTIASGGSLVIFNGGSANTTEVNNSIARMTVSSGGTAKFTTLAHYGSMTVFQDGTADNNTITSSGSLIVNGGTVNKTKIICGSMTVSSGGTANSNTINASGWMSVCNGATANSNTVNDGYIIVYSGGTANFNTFNGGNMNVSSGGTANSNTINVGWLYANFGGTANSNTINSSGRMSVNGTANSITVNSGGILYVNYNGTANSITVNSGGHMHVSGTALEITENGGYIDVEDDADVTFVSNSLTGLKLSDSATVHSGTTATSTTIEKYGELHISSGGTADSTTVNDEGRLFVTSGGTATEVIISSEGVLSLEVASNTYIQGISSGSAFLMENGYLSGYQARNGTISVKSDGTVTNTVISNGRMDVSSGGTATATIINEGYMGVYSGGTANATIIDEGGMNVYRGGTADSTTLNSGYMDVYSGGTANATTIDGGKLSIDSGGTMISTTINSGGIGSNGGGTMTYTTVNSGGGLKVVSSGIISGLQIESGAEVAIGGGTQIRFDLPDPTFADSAFITNYDLIAFSGTIDYSVTVASAHTSGTYQLIDGVSSFTTSIRVFSTGDSDTLSVGETIQLDDTSYTLNLEDNKLTLLVTLVVSGSIDVESGEVFTSATIAEGGIMHVLAGGTAAGTEVSSGGSMEISRGGKHTGTMTIAEGGLVSVSEGGIVDFDISAVKPNDTPFINDLSMITGTPSYTITVTEDQAEGAYLLADGASGFTGSITIGTDAAEYGTLTLNGDPLKYEAKSFSLLSDDTVLKLQVLDLDIIPPTDPADLACTVSDQTAEFTWTASEDNYEVASYTFVYGTSSERTEGTSVTVTENAYQLTDLANGTYYWWVRAVDTSDLTSNWVEGDSFTIDYTPPDDPPTKPENLTCTVKEQTASFTWAESEDDHGVAGYTFVYGTSSDRTKGISITVTENAYQLTGLANGTYHWWVQAVDTTEQTSDWVKGKSFKIKYNPPDNPPTTPDGLISEVNKKNVSFTWNPSEDETGVSGYYFRYGTTRDLGSETTVTVTTNAYELQHLKNNVYYWQVQAFDTSSQTSDWSTVQTFTIDYVDYPPTTPENLSQTVSGRAVTFTWNASRDDDGVAGYRLRYGTGKDLSHETTITVKDTSYSISRLAGGNYYWQVQAIDTEDQTSEWSAEQSFTIVDNPPSTPTDLNQIINGLSVTFTWTESTDDYGVSGYELRYGTSSDLTPKKIITVNGPTYSPGKLTGGNYYWQVRALDDAKQVSEWSDVQAFTIAQDDPPTTPENPKQSVKNDTAKLTWDPAVDDYGVTKYVLRYSSDETMSSATEITLSDCSCILENVKNGRWYWQVKAVDREDQTSDWSTISSFVVSYSKDLPDAPQGNYITAAKKKNILSWAGYSQEQAQRICRDAAGSQPSSGQKVKVSYQVKIDGGNILDCAKNELPLSNLRLGTHNFAVRAVFEQSGSAPVYTNWNTFDAVVPDARPLKTGQMTMSQIGENTLRISWTKAADSRKVDYYRIVCGIENRIVSGDLQSSDFSGINASKITAYLTAYDDAGTAGKTVKKTLKMKDMTAPDQVTGLTSLEVNNKSGGYLTWKPSSDNVGVTQYLIEIEGQKTYKSKTNLVKIKKLAAGNYKFRVTALDKAKNRSIVSEECGFSVQDVIAPKIKKLSVSATNNTASVYWNAWDETGIQSIEMVLDHDTKLDVTNQSAEILRNLSFGVHTIDLNVSDAAKNMTSKTITFNINPSYTGMLASV